jgi:long-chain fatty acid transport protein
MKLKVLMFGCLVAPLLSFAGGFQINTQGQKSTSMGGSVSSVALDGSVVFYNPGALAFINHSYFNAGVSLIVPKTSYLGQSGVKESMPGQVYTPFSLYAAYAWKPKVNVGLAINTPFGLGTKWDSNWSGRYITQEAKLNALNIQPTLSYKFNDHLSIGVGPMIVLGNADLTKALPYTSSAGDAVVELKGTGTSVGANAGINYINGNYSLGIAYRTSTKIDISSGDASFTNVPNSLLQIGTIPSSASFETSVTLPSVLSVGMGYNVTPKVLITLDMNYTGWKVYDSLNFIFADNAQLDSRQARNYKNAVAVRAGIQYIKTDRITLRAGLAFDQTPVQDGYVSPELPDANRLIYAAGLSYKLKGNFSVDFSLMYENVKERKEVDNMQTNFNGTYKTNLVVGGLGLQYEF